MKLTVSLGQGGAGQVESPLRVLELIRTVNGAPWVSAQVEQGPGFWDWLCAPRKGADLQLACLADGVRLVPPVESRPRLSHGRGGVLFEGSTLGAQVGSDLRRRVLGGPNLRQLVEHFDGVLRIPPWLENELSNVRLPFGDSGSVVQFDEGDLSVVQRLVPQIGAMVGGELGTGLGLVGTLESFDSLQRWSLDVCTRAAAKAGQQCDFRRILKGEDLGESRYLPGAGQWQAGALFVQRLYRDSEWSTSRWEEWVRRPLPAFIGPQDQPVVAVRDLLKQSPNSASVSWTTELAVGPLDHMPCPRAQVASAPWLGAGVVVERNSGAHVLSLELDGFEDIGGSNRLQGQLRTDSTGEDGRGGVHLVPGKGTRALALRFGDMRGPNYILGNLRTEAPVRRAPSVVLREPLELGVPGIEAFDDLVVMAPHTAELRAGTGKAVLDDGGLDVGGGQ